MIETHKKVAGRRKRGKRFWVVMVTVTIIAGYPLSFGPICWIASWLGYRGIALCLLYRPLISLCRAARTEERKKDSHWTDKRNLVGGSFYGYAKLLASKGWDWRMDVHEAQYGFAGDWMWTDRDRENTDLYSTATVEPETPSTEDLPSAGRKIVDDALAAFGGIAARDAVRHGYVKMNIIGDMPVMSQKIGTSITLESYFDLPEYERRDFYGDSQREHLLIITNSGTLWTGNQSGEGMRTPTPPQSVYNGPMTLGFIQTLIDLRDYDLKLIQAETTSGLLVEASRDKQPLARITFDRESRLPVQIEKTSVGMDAQNIGNTVDTTITLSQYRSFGRVTLPTEVVVLQDGRQAFRFILVAADFESPVPKDKFLIPE